MSDDFGQAEFDADVRKLWRVIPEDEASDYVKRPFSYDMGDFEPVKEKNDWQKQVPVVPAPKQESPWPFYLEMAFKLFAVLCFVVGFSVLITGGLR